MKEGISKRELFSTPKAKALVRYRLALTYSWLTTSSSSEDDAVSSRSRAITTGISFRVCHAVSRWGPQRPFLADSPDQTI